MPAARVYWWETGGSDPGGGQAREAAQKDVNGHSVGVAKASLYLFGCFCYNCCCCCCCRGWCGEDFYWPSWICYEIELGRDRWLWGLHLVCFCIHTAWAVAAYTGGMDSDMLVTIYRVKPSWQNRGGAYAYEVVPLDDDKQFLHIHVVTALFFGFSACMHGIWVFIGPWSKRLLWDKLDDCLCLWRWFEYSLSASLMLVGIAVVTAIRDQNTLAGIAFLSFSTMWCGYFTELLSRPVLQEDGCRKWAGDPDPPKRPKGDDPPESERCAYRRALRCYARARRKNYAARMFPHVMGFFPYITAWAIILNNWQEQIDDLCQGARDQIPDWVPVVIYGSLTIFSLFTFVQWRYQWTAPEHYWRSEVWYCILSATSKVYLGWILYVNVIAKASFNEAVSRAGGNFTAVNLTEWC